MTSIIICAVATAILIAAIFYHIGKASVKQPDIAPRELSIDTTLLDKWENERRATKTSTRYVRMDKDDVERTNSDIKMLEIDDYAVTDYDTEDGIITMEKKIIQPKTTESDTTVEETMSHEA